MRKSYKEAAQQFEEVERQHPYSQWATRAQIMAAYAQYQAMDYDPPSRGWTSSSSCIPAIPRWRTPITLKALCDYERIADVRRTRALP